MLHYCLAGVVYSAGRTRGVGGADGGGCGGEMKWGVREGKTRVEARGAGIGSVPSASSYFLSTLLR